MTTMTTRAQGLFVDEVRAAARRSATTPSVRHQWWTSLRRWHATAPWDELAELREQSFARHEAVERRLFVALR